MERRPVVRCCRWSCVTYRHEHAWPKVFAVRMSYLQSHFFSLMFHPPSLLFPHGHFDTMFPSAPSSSSVTRPRSAGQAHPRTCADPTHLRGYEPKEFDKISSVDGDTTPINDPDHDSISDFSKTTRENTGLFVVFPQCLKPLFRTFLRVTLLFREEAKKACLTKPLQDREKEEKVKVL